ncbi:MAG: ergothioneine biosynthesis protein EgtB [Planctomycetota bacterium]
MTTLASQSASPSPVTDRRDDLYRRFDQVRDTTEAFCRPLQVEDYVLQAHENASPTKWHLAHTSWFFEKFVLEAHVPNYEPFRRPYYFLFNSYYNTAGPMHCRPNRGLISRPTVEETYAYRRVVNERVHAFFDQASDVVFAEAADVIELGLHHEQQHQELMVTDLKYNFSCNPLLPAYRDDLLDTPEHQEGSQTQACGSVTPEWLDFQGGLVEVGHPGNGHGFSFDNEHPRHRVFLHAFQLADRCVTNAEFAAFIADGGYERHELWLSAGYAWATQRNITQPLYWFRDGAQGNQRDMEIDAPTGVDGWSEFTLAGPRAVHPDEPVSHLSYFEADAFARWAGARLPTEFEWEHAVTQTQAPEAPPQTDDPTRGSMLDDARFHPVPGSNPSQATSNQLQHAIGNLWEWTSSSYAAYPGYTPLPGALGEYNGKFMCNQYVLRGGSCATPISHARPTYRNFFSPESRWQFAGLRLAR